MTAAEGLELVLWIPGRGAPPTPLTPPDGLPPAAGVLLREAQEVVERWAGGGVVFLFPSQAEVLLPPFPLPWAGTPPGGTEALRAWLAAERRLGIVLLRLGRYSVGLFEGQRLGAAKSGRRLVHGRHRAGGSSAGRFQRRREKEVAAFFLQACSAVEAVLGPHLPGLDHVLLGGEKVTATRFQRSCPLLEGAGERVLDRRLQVVEASRAELEGSIRQAYASIWVRLQAAEESEGGGG